MNFLHCLICGAQEGPHSVDYNPLIDGWVCRPYTGERESCAGKAQKLVSDYGNFDLARRTQHLIYQKKHK